MKRKRIRMKMEESRQGHMKRVLQTLLQENCNICKFSNQEAFFLSVCLTHLTLRWESRQPLELRSAPVETFSAPA